MAYKFMAQAGAIVVDDLEQLEQKEAEFGLNK